MFHVGFNSSFELIYILIIFLPWKAVYILTQKQICYYNMIQNFWSFFPWKKFIVSCYVKTCRNQFWMWEDRLRKLLFMWMKFLYTIHILLYMFLYTNEIKMSSPNIFFLKIHTGIFCMRTYVTLSGTQWFNPRYCQFLKKVQEKNQ